MNAPLAVADVEVDLPVVPKGYELVNGSLVEMPVSLDAAWVGGQLFVQVNQFVQANNLGWAFPAETAYRCFPGFQKTVRKPDVSFIRRDRLPRLSRRDARIPPDLAVEVVSPTETVYELNSKVEDYLAVGVRLVWVIDPENRLALVYRADGSVGRLREPAGFDGEDVLPGFRCPLALILPAPPPPGGDPGASATVSETQPAG
jgi:Uma2 family endonuclease